MKLGLKEALDQHRKVRGNDDNLGKMYVRYWKWHWKALMFGAWVCMGFAGLGLIIHAFNQSTISDQETQIQR